MKIIIPVLTVLLASAGTAVHADDTSLVVYNSDLGLVKQPVELDVVRGAQTVVYDDIPERIDPTSVRLDLKGSAGFLNRTTGSIRRILTAWCVST